MLKTNARRACPGIGYQPGKSPTLVRNPNWNAEHRLPPGVPEPDQHQHRRRRDRDRPSGARRQRHGPDRHAGAADRQAGLPAVPSQITITPGAGDHYIALNNSTGRSRTSTCARRCGRRSTAQRSTRLRGGKLVGRRR